MRDRWRQVGEHRHGMNTLYKDTHPGLRMLVTKVAQSIYRSLDVRSLSRFLEGRREKWRSEATLLISWSRFTRQRQKDL